MTGIVNNIHTIVQSSSVALQVFRVRYGLPLIMFIYTLLTAHITYVCGQAPPLRHAEFTVSFDYECRDWNPKAPTICQTSKFNITTPFKIRILGYSEDIDLSCNAFIGKGYGKGTHLSVFLYKVIMRLASDIEFNEDINNFGHNFRTTRDVENVDPSVNSVGNFFQNSASLEDFEANSTGTDIIKNITFSDVLGDPQLILDGLPFSGLSQGLRSVICSHDYSKSSYRGIVKCPSECGSCSLPLYHRGNLLRWHNGNGLCINPVALKGASYWCLNDGVSQVHCEDWMLNHSKMYLYSHSDENDPCDENGFGHNSDITKLQCLPNV